MSHRSSLDGRDEHDAADAPAIALRRSYAIPRNTTPHGRTAFTDVVDDYVGALTRLVEAEARRASSGGQEITADHVAAAAGDHERRRRARPDEEPGRGRILRTAAAIALTTGATGASMMAAFLHSPWQVALFTIFAVVFVLGVVLSWIGGRHG